MIFQSFVCFFAINALIGCSFAAEYMEKKPDFIKTCQRNTPDEVFIPCSTESIQILLQKLGSGIDGIEIKTDRIRLKKIKVFSSDGPVSLNTSLSNASLKGFENAIVVRSYASPVDFTWDSHILIPKLRLEGDYEMNGRILLLPLQGRGKCWIEPLNVDVTISTKPKLYKKFGHIFYNITETKIDFNMTGLRLQLDNLFNGIKARQAVSSKWWMCQRHVPIKVLEDNTNAFLNENWKPVSEAFKPLIKKTIEDIVLEIFNKIFNYMPAEYLVSDIHLPHPSKV